MKVFQQIKKEHESKMSQLLNDCRVFWAFSNEQFKENKTPLREGEKYVSIGGGGYMPKGFLNDFETGIKNLKKWFTNEVKGCRKEHILYELQNHEAFYTNSIEDTMQVLKGLYTPKQVWDVYNAYRLTPEYQSL